MRWRSGLAAIARCRGGLRESARRASVDYANLRRWLAGATTLGEEAVSRLEVSLGFLDGRLAPGIHSWSPDAPRKFLAPALECAFPRGARALARETSRLGSWPRAKKLLKADLSPEPFVIGVGKTYVFLLRPAGLSLNQEDLGPDIELEYAPDTLFSSSPWISGTPSLQDAINLLNEPVMRSTENDLVAFLAHNRISPDEALAVLQTYVSQRNGDKSGR